MEKMIRIFVAFPMHNFGSNKFSQFIEENRASIGLKWTRNVNLHITLFFIGEIKVNDLDVVMNTFANFKKTFTPFTLAFERYIVKGKITNPTMLWAEFFKSNSFTTTAEQLESLFSPYMSVPTIHKDPIPHCTLAQIKGKNEIVNLNLITEIFLKTIQVDYPELWQTTRDEEGIVYKKLL